jgi:hypothetical protein
MDFLDLANTGSGPLQISAEEDDRRLLDAIATICTHLTTEHRPKAHGGYDVYKDERICIRLDTYVPNIDVTWRGTQVLVRSYNGSLQVNRPGCWTDYIKDVIWPMAAWAEREEREAQEAERAREWKRDFSPIGAAEYAKTHFERGEMSERDEV